MQGCAITPRPKSHEPRMAEPIVPDREPGALGNRAHDQRKSVAAVHMERPAGINPCFDQPAA
jgi:hypothetical protein